MLAACRQGRVASISDEDAATVALPRGITSVSSWVTPARLTPLTFLETMKKKGGFGDKIGVVVMIDSFPSNWLKRGDIDTLIKLVTSKEKCNCFLNPLSSFIPRDSADIGGYAGRLLDAYRRDTVVSFGLYACPKATDKDSEDLKLWWQSLH